MKQPTPTPQKGDAMDATILAAAIAERLGALFIEGQQLIETLRAGQR